MSELINNARKRKELLKHLLLQLHRGQAPEAVREQLLRLMGKVPHGEIAEVEQELIAEGIPAEEIMKFCDVHAEALKGAIDRALARIPPPGHPADTFTKENRALGWEIEAAGKLYENVSSLGENEDFTELWREIRNHFNALMDVDKHYRRKENLVFPFLEKRGITGPPTVMWGKDDEVRELLKTAIETLTAADTITAGEASSAIDLALRPASTAVEDMIFKEEEILLPMCMDNLTEDEWYEIYRQSDEIGYCLYDPKESWRPAGRPEPEKVDEESGRIRLPSGSMTVPELTAILNTIPFDLTFVDRDDRVRYFTQGRERIFSRSRAILGRQVQFCHPPSSVDVVQRIIDDFKSNKQDHCAFWINMNERFIMIEYYALRDDAGEYLGTLEVSQDLTEKRKLEGERRLLSYGEKD